MVYTQDVGWGSYKVELHKSRAKLAYEEIKNFKDGLNIEIFEDFEKIFNDLVKYRNTKNLF